MIKRMVWAVAAISFCFMFCGLCRVWAQEEGASDVDWKEEFRSDRQEIKVEHQEMKESAGEARVEEKQLKQKIRDALAAGDKETAAQLKEQLRSMHQQNMQDKRQDIQELRKARQEMMQDKKEALENLTPEQRQKIKERHMDRDNNPPGPRGGKGTNWENPPGPKGARGASPNRKNMRSR